MVAKSFDSSATAILRLIDEVHQDEMILDIGPVTAREWSSTIEESGTIIWNGPMGVFEFDQFGEGTREIAEAIARSSAYSLAGGGDTIAAIDKYEVSDNVSYISTGGGAFMEYLEGKKLPGVDIL
jgi:phosphoglycerate kinase